MIAVRILFAYAYEWRAAVSLALPLTDDLVAALFSRARELGLIEERRRWAEIDGVAEHLGVSERRVRDLRERGMPANRIGRKLLFDLREVDAWLERQGWEERPPA